MRYLLFGDLVMPVLQQIEKNENIDKRRNFNFAMFSCGPYLFHTKVLA